MQQEITDNNDIFDIEAAYEFLNTHDSPLNRIRLDHWSGTISDEEFCKSLSEYQHENGGFMGGLDPDYNGTEGSIHSSIEALRIFVSHHQTENSCIDKLIEFLNNTQLPDGTWCELPAVMKDPMAPQWYAPAQYRIYETASIAGYGIDIGYVQPWAKAVRYLKAVWAQIPVADTPQPYNAILLLIGRSKAPEDREIIFDAIDNIGHLARKNKVDPYDAANIIETLNNVEFPEAKDLMIRLVDIVKNAQNAEDGGINTAYGKHLKPHATFNALMAVALMMQRGLIQ